MESETFLRYTHFYQCDFYCLCLSLFTLFHGMFSWCKQVNQLNPFLVFFDVAIPGQCIFNFLPKSMIKKRRKLRSKMVYFLWSIFKTSHCRGFQLLLRSCEFRRVQLNKTVYHPTLQPAAKFGCHQLQIPDLLCFHVKWLCCKLQRRFVRKAPTLSSHLRK